MNIFIETKELVRKEKFYTAKVLKNLMLIEKDKLYSDIKYPSLYNYLVQELLYTEAEAVIRVNAVRLMLKSKSAEKKIENGEMTLSNAAAANKALQNNTEKLELVVEKAATSSTRDFKKFIALEFRRPRQETLILPEFILEKMDKLREEYGDVSNFEILQILLEEKLKTPSEVLRVRPCKSRVSRGIPLSVRAKVYTGKCANCEVRYNLEYDHIKKFALGGDNSAGNLQILCRSCNQRKEIRHRMRA